MIGGTLVVDDGVAQDHAVLRVLVLPHERRQPFHQPGGRIGGDRLAELPLEEDLVLEDVRQLVRDELQQLLVASCRSGAPSGCCVGSANAPTPSGMKFRSTFVCSNAECVA